MIAAPNTLGANSSWTARVAGRCRTILVVEDDATIRIVLEDILSAEGYEVITAENGRDGLACLAQSRDPCVILLDLMMPVMSGGEFLRVLRQDDDRATLPVVVVSAWPDEAAKVKEQTQGYLRKPVSLGLLLDVVSRFCSDQDAVGDDASRDKASRPFGLPKRPLR